MSFVTGPEKRACVLTQSQQIQWPLDQDLLPGRRTGGKILRNPGTQGFLVQTLPGIGGQSLRLQQVCPCPGLGVERIFGHERVALEYMSKDKLRKLLQQCVQAIPCPQAVVVDVVNQGVETLNSCGAGRTEREAPNIDDVNVRHKFCRENSNRLFFLTEQYSRTRQLSIAFLFDEIRGFASVG
jgi:hypothetical protein